MRAPVHLRQGQEHLATGSLENIDEHLVRMASAFHSRGIPFGAMGRYHAAKASKATGKDATGLKQCARSQQNAVESIGLALSILFPD
ncbi:hypothetical protein ACFSTD_13335 [Novosphingobium colocasiae]